MLKVTLSDRTIIYVKCLGEALEKAHKLNLNVLRIEG